MRRRPPWMALLVWPVLAAAGCSDDAPAPAPPPDLGSVDDIMRDLPNSCAFQCGECAEPGAPFACPTLKPWSEIPHAEACGTWDGTYPEPVQGRCAASEPSGEAARKAGPIQGGYVLPDGHRIRPAGREVQFAEVDLVGGFPMSIEPVPGARFALVSDGGILDNALRIISLDALAANGDPVAGYVEFPRPSSLYYGIAFLPPDRVLASGGSDAMIYAFDLDPQTGAIARATAGDIALGTAGEGPWYSGAIAATAAGDRLLVAPSEYAEEILVLSLAAADYGTKIASIPIPGSHALFDLRLDPFDPSGVTLYASDQSASRLLEVDAASAEITRTIELQKNPAQIAFLDATYLVVAESDSDALAVVNRASGVVEARVPVFEPDAARGFSPNALAYDAAGKRLYAALAGVNAVEAYDVGAGSPPVITPAGRIPTGWWPTAVMVDTDGSLVVINGKGNGAGADVQKYTYTEGPIAERMSGSVQHVPAASLGALGALTAVTDENRRLGDVEGKSEVTCPPGAEYDMPIPEDPGSGPSRHIKHVILLIRENKTYDAVFGDRPDLGDGDPSLIMASDPELQAATWQNARAIAGMFTNFDNYYTDAELSLQGHTWTIYGRTTDTMERVWLSVWGRGTRPVTTPLKELTAPEEGGVFTWLPANGLDYDNMGESLVGNGALDGYYPGLNYNQNRPDIEKSCYMAGRIRLQCDLKPFTYALQPNDHTSGGRAGAPAPEVMVAVNDEASGMLLDALSHSPTWKESLLIVTEDDPQDGGDHVDLHRTVLFMASPWVRRGYVSHGHYDMASMYKLIAHIYGIPYNNDMIQNALLPIDAFTGTPDYTPYTYLPRTVDAPCNPADTMEAKQAEAWDFDDPDNQPGLSQQIMSMMRRPRGERGVRLVQPRR